MRATLTIIRGGPKEPAALLAFEEPLPHDVMLHIKEEFDDWWNNRGGVFMINAIDLSVIDINLDVSSSGVTLLKSS